MNKGREIEIYYRSKVLSLADEMSSLKKIYLDTKFWIYLRDYILGRSTIRQTKEIYDLLKILTQESIIICPTSQYTFFELMRQDDVSTRNATAKIIDDFSKGIVTSEEETRIATEVIHYFDSRLYSNNDVFSLQSLIWTKTVYLFGVMDPYFRELTDRENFEIQKVFVDEVWNYDYKQVLDFLNKMNMPIPDDIQLVEAFNYEKQNNPVENITFRELSYYELKGILNFYKDKFETLLEYQKLIFNSDYLILNDNTKLSTINEMIEFILNDTDKNIIDTELPFFRIRAGILAAIRLDPNRKFKLTDFKDFGHASVALPYYDYFFTDNSFKHLLCNKPLQYDKKYNCEIHSSFDSVLECLKSIEEKI